MDTPGELNWKEAASEVKGAIKGIQQKNLTILFHETTSTHEMANSPVVPAPRHGPSALPTGATLVLPPRLEDQALAP